MLPELHSAMAIVGNLNVDLWVQTVNRFPPWDEEHLVDSARVELAGTAGYVMRACHGLGIDVLAVSTVGDDLFGGFLRDQLHMSGWTSQGIEVVAGAETPLSLIFVGEHGQRSILSTLGAHRHLDSGVVRRHDAQIARCRELFLCGNYLLPRLAPSDVVSYAEEARGRGQLVAFDPSWDPAGWGEQTRRDTYRLLRVVDVYLPNEEELIHLTGQADWRVALRDVALLSGEVVLKRGASGAVYVAADDWVEVPGFPIKAVNTIGAGDVFDVGYLFGRRMGWVPQQRLQFACALAALVVAQGGERTYPDAATVRAFLRQHTADAVW